LKKSGLLLLVVLLTGCSASDSGSSQDELSLKDSCVQIAEEFQNFFESGGDGGDFVNDMNSLAIGLAVVSANAQPELSNSLNTYIDLFHKAVDADVSSDAEFSALAEPRHGTARDLVFDICAGEGIRLN
jgi:hypothetical protein